jgi:hypothetical protein
LPIFSSVIVLLSGQFSCIPGQSALRYQENRRSRLMPLKAHSLSGLSGADLAWISGVVEAALAPKIDELTGSKGIGRHLHGLLKRAAIVQIRGDVRRPKGVIADARRDAGGFGAPLDRRAVLLRRS